MLLQLAPGSQKVRLITTAGCSAAKQITKLLCPLTRKSLILTQDDTSLLKTIREALNQTYKERMYSSHTPSGVRLLLTTRQLFTVVPNGEEEAGIATLSLPSYTSRSGGANLQTDTDNTNYYSTTDYYAVKVDLGAVAGFPRITTALLGLQCQKPLSNAIMDAAMVYPHIKYSTSEQVKEVITKSLPPDMLDYLHQTNLLTTNLIPSKTPPRQVTTLNF